MNRQSLLATITTLQEQTITLDLIGEPVTIRELTAKQIADAREAARQDDLFDGTLWSAMIVQMGVIDAETKQPVFLPADVPALMDGRNLLIQELSGAIINLSAATPKHMEEAVKAQTFRQRDAGEGASDAEAGT